MSWAGYIRKPRKSFIRSGRMFLLHNPLNHNPGPAQQPAGPRYMKSEIWSFTLYWSKATAIASVNLLQWWRRKKKKNKISLNLGMNQVCSSNLVHSKIQFWLKNLRKLHNFHLFLCRIFVYFFGRFRCSIMFGFGGQT